MRTITLLGIALIAAACGGSGSAPTAATSTTTTTTPTGGTTLAAPTLSVTSLQVQSGQAPMNFSERSVTFSWTSVAGATSYLLEVGQQVGGSNLVSQSLITTSLAKTFFPTEGDVFARVTAKNATTSSAASTLLFSRLVSQRDYTESLFLGSGPFSVAAPNTGCSGNVLRGWPEGSTITITIASSLSASLLTVAQASAGHASEATNGAITAVARTSAEAHPTPGLWEIVVEQGSDASFTPTSQQSTGVFTSGRISLPDSNGPLAHELGHGLYGFCHLAGIVPLMSIMGQVSPSVGVADGDILATRAVYAAGLRPGATRSQFVAAGLIK